MPLGADPVHDEVTSRADGSPGLYAQLLGGSWLQLAEPIRRVHGSTSTLRGQLRIAHNRSRVARILAALLRLPRPHRAAETRLTIAARGDLQQWHRTFDGRPLDTWQYRIADELAERFGVLEFRFHLEVSEGNLVFRQREASVVLGSVRLPPPAAWTPQIEAREGPEGAHRIRVYVQVALPAVGPLLTYEGSLDVVDTRG